MTAFTLDHLRTCIADHLGVQASLIQKDTRLVEDLGIDSLAMHALLLDIEEAGGIIPPPEALEHVASVGDLFAAVASAPVS